MRTDTGSDILVDTDPDDGSLTRRRVVTAVTAVIGTTLLGLSLASTPGDAAFYPLTAGVAFVWVVGGLASGPLHLWPRPVDGAPRREPARHLLIAVGVGLASGAVFVLGALVVREIPWLSHIVTQVLKHATRGDVWLVSALALVTGAAEEVFFRGALFDALTDHRPVVWSTVIYAVLTIATGNPMLVFAAVVMGAVFAVQRVITGGVLASMITHVVWSVIMLTTLPALFPT